MAKRDYNLIVIGAGSAGLVSAYIGAAVKAKVALIEKRRMGGDCLNTGCVPSKALIRSTKILSYIKRHKEFGIHSAETSFDFAEIMERVQAVIRKVAPHDSVERYSSLGVDCFAGPAKIISPHEVRVNDRKLTTRSIIIATGASPSIPAITGLDKVNYLTTDTLWDIRVQPQKLMVVGGGSIGCELAQCFARLGTQVTLVELLPDILSCEDKDVSQPLRQGFIKEGMDVRVNTRCKEVVVENSKQFMIVETDGKSERIEFDRLLVAAGRSANPVGLEIGLKLNPGGTLAVDEFLRTNFKNIYACGDVAGPYQFTHTAAHQAWYCAVNALFSPLKKFKADYRVIPWCTFTDPEVARAGLNENDARAKGIPCEITRYGLDDLDRAIVDGEDSGFLKVLTVPGKDEILGVTIVGSNAGDLLAEYVLAMKQGLGLNRIFGTIHVYPTMSEANKFVAGAWKKARAPQGLLALLGKFHSWRR